MLRIKLKNFRCKNELVLPETELSEIHLVTDMSVFAIRSLRHKSVFPLNTENNDIAALPVEEKTDSDLLMFGAEHSDRAEE
jgi:hypothetical protein